MTIHVPTHLDYSPSDLSFEDTYNTLKYADRAKQIKAKVCDMTLYVCVVCTCMYSSCKYVYVSMLTGPSRSRLRYGLQCDMTLYVCMCGVYMHA